MKNKLKQGILRRNAKGFGFVKIEEEEKEYHISEKNLKNALNGDEVVIKILEKSKKNNLQDEAKVVSIIKHERDTIVGTYQSNKNFGFVVPDDLSFGTDIFISKKNRNKAKNNQKVVVKITKYPEKNKNAEGKIIEIIGHINQAGVDMLSLVKEYNLPYEFPVTVIDEAKKIKQKIDKDAIKNRLDLRKEEIFTIDGDDSKDLDDAVNVKKLKNGNYILGVHIADVSHYVKDGSKLDKEAILRGTSIYMMDRVIPMLPKELSNGICSLNARQDRLAISVIIEIDKKGNVVNSKISKSVINVTERMTYNNVKKILEKSDDYVLKRYKKYIIHFKRMEELAKILKARREKNGYLSLDIPESKIILDEDGIAIDVQKYETSFANEIIEQFMLTANEVVAETFHDLNAPFIYRVHEEPDIDKVKELNKFLFNMGYKIKTKDDTIEPKAFEEILNKIKGKPEEKVISTLILRTLKVAKYEPENKGHFGIASKCYCHFTSPIRRYPDLFIHRVISKYLEDGKQLTEKDNEKYFNQAERYSETSSECEKIAQKVEREAEDIKKAEYMQDKIGNEYEGIISSITSFGVFVELENTIEGLIRFDDLGEEYFIYDEDNKTLIGERSKTTFHIGDKMKIQVIAANKQTRKIDFKRITNNEKE